MCMYVTLHLAICNCVKFSNSPLDWLLERLLVDVWQKSVAEMSSFVLENSHSNRIFKCTCTALN